MNNGEKMDDNKANSPKDGEKLITSADIPGWNIPEPGANQIQPDEEHPINYVKRPEVNFPFVFGGEVTVRRSAKGGKPAYYESGWKVAALDYGNGKILVQSPDGDTKTYTPEQLAAIQLAAPDTSADILPQAADRARGVVGDGEKSPEERQELVQEAAEDMGEEAVEQAGVKEPIPPEVPEKSPEIEAVEREIEALLAKVSSQTDRAAIWRFATAIYQHERQSALDGMSREVKEHGVHKQYQILFDKLQTLRANKQK